MNTSSIIHRNGNNGKGILGGFFQMGGVTYGLSNNHVIADINNCDVGDPIFDDANRVIGTLTHWVELNSPNQGINLVDIALFQYTAISVANWLLPGGLVKPTGFTAPVEKGLVYFVRPDGSIQSGRIATAFTSVVMDLILCGVHFSFTHLTEIIPLNGGPFSEPGSSGSVVLSAYNNMLVGVVVGTSKDGTKSYAVPFADGVLKYLPLII